MCLRKSMSSVLKRAKIEKGYTYDEISEKTNISKTSVRYALNGGDNVGLNVFEELFKFFDVNISFCEVQD
jgi:transcriptional regulator with XRE-family HTH domain